MSQPNLTSAEMRRRYQTEIEKYQTFETKGLSEQQIKNYLDTPEGIIYWQRLAEADPTVAASVIDSRAIEQIGSGLDLPRMEVSDAPLRKIVPAGRAVESYSPFFGKEQAFDGAQNAGKSLSDFFALPINSEADVYDEMVMRPLAPTEIFVHRVAPTTELGGLVTKGGGGEQVLVPNRKLYAEPTYLRSIDDSLALQAERRAATAVKAVGTAGGAAAVVYDAYTTAEKYQALTAQGNDFGADALLRRYEGRTAGGVVGSMAAGATYGFVGGSETGPGAFLTGAAGGVIGAFAGEEIAKAVNDHKINHQTGSDGVTYAYGHGQWSLTQHHVDLNGAGMATPNNAPNYTSTTTPAPDDQIGRLEYKRMTAVTSMSLANAATQDTKNIDLDGTQWHATRDGWAQQVEIPGLPNTYGIPSSIAVDKPANTNTSEQLNQLAANRQFNNDHYAAEVSSAYVMDYYGKDWAANGPLPDVVTKPLGLPSEQHIKDPVTGHVWNATSEGDFSREEAIALDKMVIRETVTASAEERERLAQLQQSAAQSNEAYGEQLIAQNFDKSASAQRFAHDAHRGEQLSAATSPVSHGDTSPTPLAPAEDVAASNAAPPITPKSSNRKMFDAMMTAVGNLDVDAMRSVSQNYLQSPLGQAWLEQGQQFNQQQALVQQQATMDAQQHAQAASQGPMR